MRLARNVFPAVWWTPLAFGAAAVLVALGLSAVLPDYFVFLGVTVLISTTMLLGLGIVTGTAGMIVLSQLSFAAVGAWVVVQLSLWDFPGGFLVWLVAGAFAAGLVGLLLGLPALRLRGVNLAVVTLGFGAAADALLLKTQFPGTASGAKVPRPELFASDRAYFVLTAIVLVVVAIAVYYLQNSRIGSSWRAVAFSERGTAAAGSSVRGAKLTAFMASAAIAGVSGGLIAAQVGAPYPTSFATLQSLALYVLSIVAGSYLVEMALFGGLLWVLVPELLKRLGVPQDWGLVVFGLLGVQALTTGSNIGQDIRNAIALRRRRLSGLAEVRLAPFPDDREAPPKAPIGAPVLETEGLAVHFGKVRALEDVSLTVHEGETVGLIGPNGAGKSTLVDAVSGFLPQHTGTVRLAGDDLAGRQPHQRALAGLRRTFQQDRVPPTLAVRDYVNFVANREVPDDELRETLEFFGCPSPRTRIQHIDVGTRRMVEVAANVLAQPKVLVLDEPAAGLSHDEHVAFGQRLREVPSRFGTAVLLIEHDLDLVRSACDRVVVLNFGEVLASGTAAEVLANPAVAKAYMGETEML